MRTRVTLMRKYLQQSMVFFDLKSPGELMSRIQLDVNQLQSITTTFSSVLNIVYTVVFSLIYMVQTSPAMTGFILATTPFLVVFSMVFGAIIRKRTAKAYDVESHFLPSLFQ